MAARHDDWGMVAPAQRKAAEKYQKTNIRRYSFVLNIQTDADLIKHLAIGLHGESVNGYLKRLIREDIASAD